MSRDQKAKKVRHEFAAGGVVVKDDQIAAIVPKGRPDILALPKGHPEEEEDALTAAIREVREETGIKAQYLDKLDDIKYWFYRDRMRTHKVVRFFLLKYMSGDINDHDHEIEEVRWLSIESAAKELSYSSEQEIVTLAARKLQISS